MTQRRYYLVSFDVDPDNATISLPMLLTALVNAGFLHAPQDPESITVDALHIVQIEAPAWEIVPK